MADVTAGALEQLSALIAEIEAEAYARGQADARKELLEILGAGGGPKAPAETRRGRQPRTAPPKRRTGGGKRAPRGSVPRLVERALRARPGLTPPEILDLASTDAERLIKLSSIRVELASGRKRGRYESSEGRWSLASTGDPSMSEGGSPKSEAAADENRGKLGLAW